MKFKLRKLIRNFYMPSTVNPNVKVPREELECGHIIRGRMANPSKATQIRELINSLTERGIRRRCFECGKDEHEQA